MIDENNHTKFAISIRPTPGNDDVTDEQLEILEMSIADQVTEIEV